MELKLEEVIVEIDDLIALKSRVVKALEACKEVLRVTVVCLEERLGWKVTANLEHTNFPHKSLISIGIFDRATTVNVELFLLSSPSFQQHYFLI